MGPTYMLAMVYFGPGEGGMRGRGRMRMGMVNNHVIPFGCQTQDLRWTHSFFEIAILVKNPRVESQNLVCWHDCWPEMEDEQV